MGQESHWRCSQASNSNSPATASAKLDASAWHIFRKCVLSNCCMRTLCICMKRMLLGFGHREFSVLTGVDGRSEGRDGRVVSGAPNGPSELENSGHQFKVI